MHDEQNLIQDSYHYTVGIGSQNTIVMLAEVHHIWEHTAPKIYVGRGRLNEESLWKGK